MNYKMTIISVIFVIFSGCGMQLTVPAKEVSQLDIANLEKEGFITVGTNNIAEMEEMKKPNDLCSRKRNVCGMDAGIRASFLLSPREAFYDIKNPQAGSEKTPAYEKLANEYPIMRPKEFPKVDVGVFPNTLAAFWTKHLKNYRAQALGFNSFNELLPVIKHEIRDGRPVLIELRITPDGLPVFMPDNHLGVRTFWNAHWVVLVGFSENGDGTWLIRDNGGLSSTLDRLVSTKLIKISEPSLKKLADQVELAEELKLYIDDPSLPIFLDDWDNSDNEAQLQKDFKEIKAYNIIVFEKR